VASYELFRYAVPLCPFLPKPTFVSPLTWLETSSQEIGLPELIEEDNKDPKLEEDKLERVPLSGPKLKALP
jgi:hypothetical protein